MGVVRSRTMPISLLCCGRNFLVVHYFFFYLSRFGPLDSSLFRLFFLRPQLDLWMVIIPLPILYGAGGILPNHRFFFASPPPLFSDVPPSHFIAKWKEAFFALFVYVKTRLFSSLSLPTLFFCVRFPSGCCPQNSPIIFFYLPKHR